MSHSPFTGRVRLYFHKDQDQDETARVFEVFSDLGMPDSAMITGRMDFELKDGDGVSPWQQEIIEDAEAGRYEALVIASLDRLSTDAVELSRLLTGLDDAGVLVIALAECFCSEASLTQTFFPNTISNKE
jgi:hypothetical protein